MAGSGEWVCGQALGFSAAGIGVDIGSTATKAVVVDRSGSILSKIVIPTGYSSVEAAEEVRRRLSEAGFGAEALPVVATGYGRIAVPFANKVVTEITCHGRGAWALFGSDGTVIDIGGQDTKAIGLKAGKVVKFVMNDKCSAGTGRFLEIMADRLGVSQAAMADMARAGEPTEISNMCTVFAESEVISLVGKGEPRENIANGVISSVVKRVATLVGQVSAGKYFLTGGLCENDYVRERLEAELSAPVESSTDARFAGALGAALAALEVA